MGAIDERLTHQRHAADLVCNSEWRYVLSDNTKCAYVVHRPNVFPEALLTLWSENIMADIRWDRPYVNEKRQFRVSAWVTSPGCTCTYNYGGKSWKPQLAPPWFKQMTMDVMRWCAIDEAPNACNLNLYESGYGALGWHADREQIFSSTDNCIRLVSLPLGADRLFQLRERDAKTNVFDVLLRNGPPKIVYHQHKIAFVACFSGEMYVHLTMFDFVLAQLCNMLLFLRVDTRHASSAMQCVIVAEDTFKGTCLLV